MEVRLRHASDAESRVLADIPFRAEAIGSIIPTLGAWGVIASNASLYDEDSLMGQFVDDGHRAYFEVVIGFDD